MSDYKSTFKDPMYWVSVGVGLGAIGLAVSQTRRGSAGRRYEPSEWLEFFVEPQGEVDDSLRAEGAVFSDKANEVYDAWAESRGAKKAIGALLDDHVRPNRDSVAYSTYASIVGHGVGLWDGELFTGIGISRDKADMLGKDLDRFVKANAELSRLGHRLDESISMLRMQGE
jgi:hypothetical protein